MRYVHYTAVFKYSTWILVNLLWLLCANTITNPAHMEMYSLSPSTDLAPPWQELTVTLYFNNYGNFFQLTQPAKWHFSYFKDNDTILTVILFLRFQSTYMNLFLVHHQVRGGWMVGGSRRTERATSHRWLPDSWVNRKEIFPCLTWPKLSTELPLLSLSVRMAEHWYRTSMGRAKDFSKASCDVSVVTPPCPLTVSSLFQMPGLWAHRPFTQASHRSGASALTVPNEWEIDNQQRLSSTRRWKCQIREHANSSVYSAFYCNCWQDSSSIFNYVPKKKREWILSKLTTRDLFGDLCVRCLRRLTWLCQ